MVRLVQEEVFMADISKDKYTFIFYPFFHLIMSLLHNWIAQIMKILSAVKKLDNFGLSKSNLLARKFPCKLYYKIS